MDPERLQSGLFYHAAQANPSCQRESGIPPGLFNGIPHRTSKREEQFNGAGKPATTIRHNLPLLEVSADVDVVATTSCTLLTQVFSNHTDAVIPEATYLFPLYDGSTVVSFRCWVGMETVIEGVVKPKDEARIEFEDAKKRQKVATLLEEHTPEIFETSIGNIPPRTMVRVEITYLNELKSDIGGQGVLVTIPTSIAPRYGSPPVDCRGGLSSGRGLKIGERGMKIKVEISAAEKILRMESRTHPISFELGCKSGPTSTDNFADLADTTAEESGDQLNKARATLCSRTPLLDRDFSLLIVVAGTGLLAPRALMEHCSAFPESSALKVSFTPRDLFTAKLPKNSFRNEIILLADRSGSMWGKVDTLRRSLDMILKNIPNDECHINICSFGSSSSTLWPSSLPCTAKNVKIAQKFLAEKCYADMGGTELKSGLETALRTRMIGRNVTTQIIVLTDGEVWDTHGSLDLVRRTRTKHGDKVRFFGLGIGDEVSHQLIEGIGREGGGFGEVVGMDDHPSQEAVVMRMLQGALTPENWKCQMTLGTSVSDGAAPDISKGAACLQAPFQLSSIHAFARSTVYFLLESQVSFDTVFFTAEASNGLKVTANIPIEHVHVPTPRLHHLAAKAIVKDLEGGQSFMHLDGSQKAESSAVEAKARQEAERLGMKWSIAGKWTSFVGVDSLTGKENVARLYRADRMELSELTKPRNLGQIDPFFMPRLPWFPDASNGYNDDGDDDDDDDDGDDDEGPSSGGIRRLRSCGKSLSALSRNMWDDEDEGDGFGGSGSSDSGSCRNSYHGSSSSPTGSPGSQKSAKGAGRGSGGGSNTRNTRSAYTGSFSATFGKQRGFHDEPWSLFRNSLSTHSKDFGMPSRRAARRFVQLLRRQTRSGAFDFKPLEHRSMLETVLSIFTPRVIEDMESYIDRSIVLDQREKRIVCETTATTVYFKVSFPNEQERWEPAIGKARSWTMSILKDDTIRENLEALARRNLNRNSTCSGPSSGHHLGMPWSMDTTLTRFGRDPLCSVAGLDSPTLDSEVFESSLKNRETCAKAGSDLPPLRDQVDPAEGRKAEQGSFSRTAWI
jgi:hypothetical protein